MHVCSVGSTLSNVPVARAPWQWRIRHLLLVTVSIGLLSIGQAAAQEAGGAASAQEAGGPASAQAVVSAAEQTLPSGQPGRNGKVCEYEEVTGSRMKKRVCYTPEQWEARERAAKELVRELDGRAVGRNAEGD